MGSADVRYFERTIRAIPQPLEVTVEHLFVPLLLKSSRLLRMWALSLT